MHTFHIWENYTKRKDDFVVEVYLFCLYKCMFFDVKKAFMYMSVYVSFSPLHCNKTLLKMLIIAFTKMKYLKNKLRFQQNIVTSMVRQQNTYIYPFY